MEELEEILFDPDEPRKFFKIGKLLHEPLLIRLIEFIWDHKNEFSWSHHDILEINLSIIVHKLNVDHKATPVKQKRRSSIQRDMLPLILK